MGAPDFSSFGERVEAPDFSRFGEPVDGDQNQSGDFSRGFKVAFEQIPQLGYGLAAITAAGMESALGEGGMSTSAKNWAVQKYDEWGKTIQSQAKDTDEFDVSFERAKQGDFGALVDWLQYGVGYGIAQGVQILGTGGVGAIAGKAVLKPAVEKLVGGMVAKEAERLIASGVAKDVAQKQAVASIAAQAGALGATGAQAFGMEGGEIGGDLTSTATKEGRVLTGTELARAAGATALAGLYEFAGDALGLGAMLGKVPVGKSVAGMTGLKGRATRGLVAGTMVAPAEGVTEYLQTGVEEYGKGTEGNLLPFNQSAENQRQAINAAALGTVGGAVMGGGGGAFTAPEKPQERPIEKVLDSVSRANEAATARAVTAIGRAGTVDEAIAAAAIGSAAEPVYESDVSDSAVGGLVGRGMEADFRTAAQKAEDEKYAPMIAQRDERIRAATARAELAKRIQTGKEADAEIAARLNRDLDNRAGVLAEELLAHDEKGLTGAIANAYRAELVRKIEALGFEAPAAPSQKAGLVASAMAPRETLPAKPVGTIDETAREAATSPKGGETIGAVPKLGTELPKLGTVDEAAHAAALSPVEPASTPPAAVTATNVAEHATPEARIAGRPVSQMSERALQVALQAGSRRVRRAAQVELDRRAAAGDGPVVVPEDAKEILRTMAENAGHLEVGGRAVGARTGFDEGQGIRSRSDMNEDGAGRTSWVGQPEWAKGFSATPEDVKAAVEKAIAGKPLGAKQRDIVKAMLAEVAATRSNLTESLAEAGIPTDAETVAIAELVDKAEALEPGIAERFAMQHDTDAAHMVALVQFLKERENAPVRKAEEDHRLGEEATRPGPAAEEVAQNPEQRSAAPVAESQAPVTSEPGDAGVAPGQAGAAPDAENTAGTTPATASPVAPATTTSDSQIGGERPAEGSVQIGGYSVSGLGDKALKLAAEKAASPEKRQAAQDELNRRANVANPARFAVGRALTPEQRKKVLASLVDVYKLKNAPKEDKGVDARGEEIIGYAYSPEYFEKSDITGAMVRYYVTLPDGKIAHPTELFPDYTQSHIDAALAEQREKIRQQKSEVERYEQLATDSAESQNAYWQKRSDESLERHGQWRTIAQPSERVMLTKGGRFMAIFNHQKDTIAAAEEEGWQRTAERPALDLAAQTEAELKAKQDALDAKKAEEKKAEEDAKAAREKKEIAQRSTAAAGEFTLAGTEAVDKKRQAEIDAKRAEAELAGQKDIFSQPANTLSPADLLRAAAAKMDEAAKPVQTLGTSQEVQRNRNEATTAAGERITDAGENLWANRRNFTRGAINWDSVKDLNDALKVKEVVKAKVWPKPDYEQLVEQGMEPFFARMVKHVYDGISTAPAGKSDADLERYIAVVGRVREAVFDWAKDNNANREFLDVIAASAQSRMQRGPIAISSMYDDSKKLHDIRNVILDRVWPGTAEVVRGRFRDGEPLAEIRAIGGNRALRALQFTMDDAVSAMKDLEKGWPASQEQWQRQGIRVLERAKAITVRKQDQPGGKDPLWVIEIDGRYSTYSREEVTAESLYPAEAKWLVVDKRRDVVATAETEDAAKDKARELVKREAKGGDIRGMNIEAAERKGPDRRQPGENVGAERLMQEFDFRGVNFGREGWINQAERQAYLNHAYDGLLDLAEIMDVPPKALSLNGMLGIAFGAQGKGGNVAAHFVPGHNEINLTKTMGAGTLAHEWGHALDHYFATQGGLAKNAEPFMSAHATLGETRMKTDASGRKTGTESRFGEMRPEIVRAFKAVVEAMERRSMTEAEVKAQGEMSKNRALRDLETWIQRFRKDIERFDASKLPAFDKLAERLRKGDLGEGSVKIGQQVLHDVVGQVKALVKDIQGASTNMASNWKGLDSNASHLAYKLAQKEATQEHIPQTTNTVYAGESARKDRDKGGKPYWRTRWEMFARAFETYVANRLEDLGRANTFLSDASQRAEARDRTGEGFASPYPRGEDRERTNAAIDKLVQAIETRETDRGVEMRQPKAEYNPDQLDLAYENAETRPGTTEEQKSLGIAALKSLFGRDRRAGATVLGSALWKDFTEHQGAELIGQQVGSAEDLAQLAQVLRDPRFETLRFFFVKGDAVVGHTGMTSRLPGAVAFATSKEFREAVQRNAPLNEQVEVGLVAAKAKLAEIGGMMQALGADGYWVLHNHPSGSSTPSKADIQITKQFDANLKGFRGHVVIDQDEYSIIDGGGDTMHRMMRRGSKKGEPELRHDALSLTLDSPGALAQVANTLKAKSGFAVMVSTSAQSKVMALAEIPEAALSGATKSLQVRAMARVRRFARMAAAGPRQTSQGVFVISEKPESLDFLIHAGLATDVTGFRDPADPFARATVSRASLGVTATADLSPKTGILRAEQARRIFYDGYRTARDFIVPETPEYEGNMTGDLARIPDAAVRPGIESLPIRLPIGIARGEHLGYGLMHMKDNADIQPTREPTQATNDRAENFVRDVVATASQVREIYTDAGRLVLRAPNTGKAIVVQKKPARDGDYYSVVTIRDGKQPVWGRPVWVGRLAFPTIGSQQSVAPGAVVGPESAETNLDRAGVQTERFDFTPKKPTVQYKGRSGVDDTGVEQNKAPYDVSYTQHRSAQPVTDTPEFKKWFGKSLVTKDGKPLVVYHGTGSDFDAFVGDASWFTETPELADAHAAKAAMMVRGRATVMPVYLSISNPLRLRAYNGESVAKAMVRARSEGHDGLIVSGMRDLGVHGDVYIVFRPEHIKSAIGNRGTFDPENPDIRLMSDSAALDPSPAEASEVEGIVSGATPHEAARWMVENGSDAQKVIAERVSIQLQRLKAAGVKLDLKVAHVGDQVPVTLLSARGLTSWKFAKNNNQVTIWLNGSDVTGKVGMSRETLLHELVHMATAGVVHLGNLKSAAGYKSAEDVKDLYKVTNHVVQHFNKRVADSKAGKTELTEFENRMYQRANNAFSNADETLAWGLTNKDAQDYMESIPYPAHESAWTAFVDAIRKLLGIPARLGTAFSELLRVAENLMGENANELLGLDTIDGENTGIQSEVNSGILAQQNQADPDTPESPNILASRGGASPWIAGSQTTGDERDSLASNAQSFVRDMLHSDEKFNWWHKTIGTQQHKALANREFRAVYDESQAFLTDVSKYANEAADVARDLLPRIDTFADFGRKSASKEDIEATTKALYAGTLWGNGSPLTGRVWSDEELRSGRAQDGAIRLPVFAGLNDRQVGIYRQTLASVSKSLEEMGKSIIHRLVRAHGIGFNRGMGLDDVVATVDEAIDDAIVDLSLDLERATEAQDEAGVAKAKREIATLQDTKAAVHDVQDKTKGLQEHGYFPAMRFGRYAIHVVRDRKDGTVDQLYFGTFENQTKANLAARELAKEFPEGRLERGVLSGEQARLFQGLSLDALETFAEYITGEDGQPIARDPLVQAFLKAAVGERSALKRHIHRKGVAGYSDDLPRVLANFTVSSARAVSGNYHGAEMLRLSNDINAGDVKDEAIKLVRYLQDPQEEAQALRGFLFAQFLGGSIAHGLVNMTQPFMVTGPYLTQYTSTADAAAKLAEAATTKPEKLTGAIRDAYTKARQEGVVAPQEIHQLRAETGGLPLAKNLALRKLSFLWGSIYSITEQFNRTTTFIAAYRIAEQKRMPNPYAFAVQAVNETQFVYNKGNRPNWARGPIGATVFTFKQFSISYLELAKRIYKHDKKAFALMLLMLLAAAGAEGLPFAEDVEDLIDTIGQWMGFATNTKKSLRKWLEAQVGKDLAQVALHGVSGLPWFPVDVSVRMGFQNLIPGTGMLKLSEENKARDVVEMIGPVGQFLPTEGTMMGRAIERISKGDIFGVVKSAAPVAVQNVAKGMEMLSTGQARDTKGRKITEVSQADAVFKMAGLQPAKVARESEIIGEVRQDIGMQRRMESEIAEQWARGIVDQEPDAVRAAMKKLHDWNRDNESLRIRVSGEQIRRRVREARRSRQDRFIRSAAPEIRGQVRLELQQ